MQQHDVVQGVAYFAVGVQATECEAQETQEGQEMVCASQEVQEAQGVVQAEQEVQEVQEHHSRRLPPDHAHLAHLGRRLEAIHRCPGPQTSGGCPLRREGGQRH